MANDMAQSSILLLGSNGQVGHELRTTLAPLGALIAVDFPDIDFTEPGPILDIIRGHKPVAVVNAAAYTAVDKAESEKDKAYAVNAATPGKIAGACEEIGACLVHYSTDYVFDGTKNGIYDEADITCPASEYGRSKRDGEIAVAGCFRHLTFRTSWVVGPHGHNFIRTMLRLAGERETLRVVGDQFGAPTSAPMLAQVTASVLAEMIGLPKSDRRWGLYHLVCGGETTWHGFAQHIVGRGAAAGLPLKARPDTIVAITTAEYPVPAKRPANSRLSTSKISSTFGLSIPDWQQAVDPVIDRIISEIKG